jgi:hypothetical protein
LTVSATNCKPIEPGVVCAHDDVIGVVIAVTSFRRIIAVQLTIECRAIRLPVALFTTLFMACEATVDMYINGELERD